MHKGLTHSHPMAINCKGSRQFKNVYMTPNGVYVAKRGSRYYPVRGRSLNTRSWYIDRINDCEVWGYQTRHGVESIRIVEIKGVLENR